MIYKCSSSLRVTSESLTGLELSNLIDVEPEKIYEKGEVISTRSGAKRNNSLWIKTITVEGDDCIEQCFAEMAGLVVDVSNSLVKADNLSADILTGVFSDNDQLNFYIPKTLSNAISLMDIDHLISGYISQSD